MATAVDGPLDGSEHTRKMGLTANDGSTELATIIKSMLKSMGKVCKGKEEQEADSVQRMTVQLERLQQNCLPPEPEGAHQERLQKTRHKTQEARDNTARLQQDIRLLEEQQEGLKTKQAGLQEQAGIVEGIVKDTEPRCRYELSLYAHISNLVWEAAGNNQISGTIVDKKARNVQHFSLEEGSLTQFELVNKLWGIVD
ncbi:hypothetical protein WJX73_007498 [Symbiochloris irregularis]|uniref:Kinetochore protein Spc24 n=1 Tax=Symbiochloris irregularis TaxID=706552 RepID=A0AAW1PKA3_9CHLO